MSTPGSDRRFLPELNWRQLLGILTLPEKIGQVTLWKRKGGAMKTFGYGYGTMSLSAF
jgi:hypothetical protein